MFLSDLRIVSALRLCPSPASLPSCPLEPAPLLTLPLKRPPRCCRNPWSRTPSSTRWAKCTWRLWSCRSRWLSSRSISGATGGHEPWTRWPLRGRWVPRPTVPLFQLAALTVEPGPRQTRCRRGAAPPQASGPWDPPLKASVGNPHARRGLFCFP